MSKWKILKRVISLVLCFVLMTAGVSVYAEILPFETQYDYKKADIAWLTDLIIKEDMTTVGGLAERVSLKAVPEYPYTETASSFKKDVDYYTSVYSLNTESLKTAYVLLFEVLKSGTGLISSDISDSDIRVYLENAGIKYPASPDADDLVMARALYTAMITGAVSGDLFSKGTPLEAALVNYISVLTGTDIKTLKEWMPESSILSLDEYILAAARMTLWTSGYDVTRDTPEKEVIRLVALMTINQQGITIDANASFDEIKVRYIALMLGKRYNVRPESSELDRAIRNNKAAYYILQLIGRKNGLSIREGNCTYDEAFRLVAENTDVFDIEPGEFYADIPLYDAHLKNGRSSVWVYPTAYVTDLTGYNTTITVNGKVVKNNYYNEIQIDPEKTMNELVIKVSTSASSYEASEFTYTVRVYQGEGKPDSGNEETTVPDTGNNDHVTSDSIVNDILASLGIDPSVSDILNSAYDSLPPELTNMIPYLAPTFDSEGLYPELEADHSEITVLHDESYYKSLLDDLGTSFTYVPLEGIPGLEYANSFIPGEEDIGKIITFGN